MRRTRIGSLPPSHDDDTDGESDPYESDPPRDPTKHVERLAKPFNSETAQDVLSSSYLTPVDALYVRNHAPVPHIADSAAHRVSFLDGETQVACASLSELGSRFRSVSVTSILQCAGNRAADDARGSGPNGFLGTPFEGLGCGMMGNVRWSGVRLSDLLPAMFPQLAASGPASGPASDAAAGLHVIFEGADGYESSTPVQAVLSEHGDCLLATHMNGEPLAADHGFPCRALLPGIAGARSVKWVTAIRLSDRPSSAPWNKSYYRRADDTEVQALPLQSVILQPTHQQHVALDADGKLRVQGVAYPGAGGAPIERVELSTDDGRSWHAATILREEVLPDDAKAPHHWVRWVARVPLSGAGAQTVCCRAMDLSGQTQPRVSEKQRGYLFNGWFRVDLTVGSSGRTG